MTDHQARQLLEALWHYMPMDLRRKVSAELPEAYAAYCRVQRVTGEMALAEHARIRS